jgi:hypothetical protein
VVSEMQVVTEVIKCRSGRRGAGAPTSNALFHCPRFTFDVGMTAHLSKKELLIM